MAQTISVTPATTTSEVQNYVENVLLGECVTVSNITFTGSLASGSGAIGEFGNGATLGIQDGLILSSGQAVYAVGPDNSNNRSFNHSLAGDPDLTDLANNFTTYDAAILEFDFIPQSDTLRFNYVFGSEEYPEYVGSPYNDVFGFFLSGPGISGPYSGGAENIALIPGTSTAVTINNINNGYSGTEPATGPCNNCAYYVDNSSGAEVQYDAFTTVLTAKAVVVPCQTYHIKIAIADAGDGALDSGVFLEEGSFSASGGDPVTLETVTGVGGVNEGCDIGSFVFRRLPGSSNSNAITVGYNVAGTATPGVDYTALPGTVTIPAGQDSVVLSIEGILDFIPEGNETVVLSLLGGGCTCTAPPVYTMNIIDNDVQLSLTTTGSTTICQGESTNLTASASGSFGPYSGSWDNGAPAGSNVSVSPSQTTTYTYTAQDACGGQTITNSETVTVITSDFTVDDPDQCFPGNTFTFTNTGATGGTVTHYWEFGDGNDSSVENPVYSYASQGTYTVTHNVIYTATGCTTSTSLPVEVFQEPSVLVQLDQQVSCVGGSDGALSTSIFGGTSPFSYLWSPNGETTSSISGLTTGFYTVNITDANGCTDVVTATMTQSDTELPVALCQDVTLQLNAAGSATLSATQVDNGSSDNCGIASLVVNPNAFSCADVGPNTVTLTVTDVNGNVASCTATVTVQDIEPPTALCQDVAVALDGSGNATVLANQVDAGSTDNCAIQSITLSPNSFDCADVGVNPVTLTVTDVGGNVSTCNANVTVTEDTDPVAVCQNLVVQLDVSGNVSITGAQVGGGSTDNCGIASIDVTPSDFTCAEVGDNTVTVTVVDGSGNGATCNATITVEDNVDPTAACQDITVQLDQSGTFSIVASDVDAGSADNCAVSSIFVSPSTFDCSNLGTETVTLTVADDFGNQSTCTADVTVLDTIPPTSICQDITVQLDGSGNASIVPSQIDNGSNDVCGIASITLDVTSFNCSNAGANVVTLTVEDNSGNTSQCTATVTVEETVPPTASCQDATVYLDELGQASISAADVDAGSTDNCAITSISVSPSDFLCAQLGIQPVTLTVEDGSGNTDNCSASITVLDTISPQIIDCPSDILVPSNSSTCASPVTWSEPTATDNCSANLASNFTSGTTFPIGVTQVFYTATDQSGNTAQCFFNVEVNADLLNINLTAITYTCGTNVSCNGADDGQATASVTGGCEPYSFLWSDGQSTSTAVDLASGDQIVTVTDANGNQLSDTIFITEPAAISTNFISSPRYPGEVNVSCFGAFDGVIYSEAEGGADCQSYQYQWTGPNGYTSTDQNPANVEAGQFSVTITDVNGCSHSDSITLIEPDPIEAETFPNSYNGFGVSCFGGSDGAINLEVTGGIPGYDYQWSNGDSIQDINALTAGQYDVLVTDTNGCQTTATVTLNEPTPVVASFTDTLLISCNGLNTGQVTVQGSGGLPGYTYLWSNGDTDQLLSGVGAGTYQAIVTDINGCQDSLEIVLTEPPAVTVDVIQITPTTCFGGNDGSATVAAAGGNGPYSYLWQPSLSNSATASGLSAGNHIYTVTDANGCDISDTLLVGQPDQMVIVTSNDTTVCPGSFVDLTATVTGGGGTYLINWESGQGFGESYSAYYQQTTNVSVTAQDQNGCTAAPNSVIVTTLQPVQADFDYQVINPCSAPFQVDFTNETTNGFSYQWYFQNGDSSTQFLASTQFDSAGVYSVNLIATSDEGCVDTLNSFITIDDLPVAAFNIPTNAACYPFMVSHQNQSTGANSFFWDFGDGETSDEGSPFHFYDEAGAYTVTLIATNQNGCSDTLMVDSAVVAYPSPVASFNPVSTGSESGNEFFMDNTSQGAVEYFWLFDGTDFSELFEPTHAFAEHGGYDIILTAYNQYGCDDTALVSVTVELTSGLFVPNAMVVGENGLGGRFQPIGTGLATYHVWVFDLWGNQLWESTSLTNGSPAEYWDGRYKGAMVPQGAYTWKIEAVFKDGEVWDGMPQASGKPKNIGSVTVIY